MEPHLAADEVARYRAGQMGPEEILRLREHVDSCPECRRSVAQHESGASLLRAWIDPEPDEQELVLFAAGKLPPARAGEIEEHIANCLGCREAVDDLRAFADRQRMVEMPPRRRPVPLWWGAVAAVVLVGVYVISRSSRPEVVATLRDGAGTVTLTKSGEVGGIPGASEQERVLIAEALRTGRVPLPAAAQADAGVLRGDQDSQPFRLFEPMRRRTLTNRPEFRWSAMAGAASYQITVFTEYEKVIDQATVSDTRWQPDRALPRGSRLYWQVGALRGSQRIIEPAPPAPRAWFEIVSAETANRLAAMRQAGGSHLRLAIAFAHEGLQVEASAIIRTVVAENPDSALAKKLRDSLLIK
jgi:hypothetical protein